jgi:hypothetical protein
MAGTEIAFENLKKLHPSLDSNNPFALAFLSCNPDLSEEDRSILRECFKKAMEREQKLLENTIAAGNLRFPCDPSLDNHNTEDIYRPTANGIADNDNICRHENSMSDESISNDKKEFDVSK